MRPHTCAQKHSEVGWKMSSAAKALRFLGSRSVRRPVLPRGLAGYPNEPLTSPIHVETPPRDAGPANRLAESLSGGGKETRITRLENGLRVASQEAFGQYSTVGGGLCRSVRVCIIWNPIHHSVRGRWVSLRGGAHERRVSLSAETRVSGLYMSKRGKQREEKMII